jgi:hypothetical protein
MLDPQVLQQHSRMRRHIPLQDRQIKAGEGDSRIHVVPTRDFMQVMQGRKLDDTAPTYFANGAHTKSQAYRDANPQVFGR